MKLYAITVATGPGGYYNCLQHSCKKFDIDLITLGWDQKWKGFAWSWDLYRKQLNKHDDDDIIMLVDGYDVIFLEHKDEILKKYKNFNKPIVLCPDSNIAAEIYFPSRNKIVINIGSMIGTAKYMRKICDFMSDKKLATKWLNDDQAMFNDIINKNTQFFDDCCAYDYHKTIFGMICSEKDLDTKFLVTGNGSIENSSLVHGAGGKNLMYYVDKIGCDRGNVIKPDPKFKLNQYINLARNSITIHHEIMLLILLIAIFVIWFIAKHVDVKVTLKDQPEKLIDDFHWD